MALLRLIEPIEGSMWIEGVNIGEIGLRDLREKLVSFSYFYAVGPFLLVLDYYTAR